MGTTQVKLFKAPSQSFVLQSAHFRKTPLSPCRYRRTSPTTLFSVGKTICRKRRCHRTTKSNRYDALGAEDEQY